MSEAQYDLPAVLKGNYKNDYFFKTVLEKPQAFWNFDIEDDLLYLRLKDKRVLCIPKIVIDSQNVCEIIIAEAYSLLAHLGTSKTLAYLRNYVWWKEMLVDVAVYCDTCITCQRSKPSMQKPYGLIHPLYVPLYPWELIGVDFVGPLPEFKNRDRVFNSITVVIDRLTAMVHLIPS